MPFIKGDLASSATIRPYGGGRGRYHRPPRRNRQDVVERVLGGLRPGAGPTVRPGQFNLGGDVMQIPQRPPMGYGRAEGMDMGNAAGGLPPGAGDEYGPDALGRGMPRPYSSPPQQAIQPPWEGQLGVEGLSPQILELVRSLMQGGGQGFAGGDWFRPPPSGVKSMLPRDPSGRMFPQGY